MKFDIIVADCPYSFSDSLSMSDVKRGANSQYKTMSIKQICDMKVKEISNPNGSLLALWVPSSLLQSGLDIMKAWGFEHKQIWIWVKIKKEPFKILLSEINKINSFKILKSKLLTFDLNNMLSFGMGHLGRNTHEVVLIGVCGSIYSKIKNRSERTVFFYKNIKHSQKPELLQDKLENIFPNLNYLEIFGRRSRNGWVVIGNESPETFGEDINVSLNNLIRDSELLQAKA